jgi:hypothetical protein
MVNLNSALVWLAVGSALTVGGLAVHTLGAWVGQATVALGV